MHIKSSIRTPSTRLVYCPFRSVLDIKIEIYSFLLILDIRRDSTKKNENSIWNFFCLVRKIRGESETLFFVYVYEKNKKSI